MEIKVTSRQSSSLPNMSAEAQEAAVRILASGEYVAPAPAGQAPKMEAMYAQFEDFIAIR